MSSVGAPSGRATGPSPLGSLRWSAILAALLIVSVPMGTAIQAWNRATDPHAVASSSDPATIFCNEAPTFPILDVTTSTEAQEVSVPIETRDVEPIHSLRVTEGDRGTPDLVPGRSYVLRRLEDGSADLTLGTDTTSHDSLGPWSRRSELEYPSGRVVDVEGDGLATPLLLFRQVRFVEGTYRVVEEATDATVAIFDVQGVSWKPIGPQSGTVGPHASCEGPGTHNWMPTAGSTTMTVPTSASAPDASPGSPQDRFLYTTQGGRTAPRGGNSEDDWICNQGYMLDLLPRNVTEKEPPKDPSRTPNGNHEIYTYVVEYDLELEYEHRCETDTVHYWGDDEHGLSIGYSIYGNQKLGNGDDWAVAIQVRTPDHPDDDHGDYISVNDPRIQVFDSRYTTVQAAQNISETWGESTWVPLGVNLLGEALGLIGNTAMSMGLSALTFLPFLYETDGYTSDPADDAACTGGCIRWDQYTTFGSSYGFLADIEANDGLSGSGGARCADAGGCQDEIVVKFDFEVGLVYSEHQDTGSGRRQTIDIRAALPERYVTVPVTVDPQQ